MPDVSLAASTLAGIDIMNEIIIVLSASGNASGSEDVKSALLELIKLARTSDRQYVVKIKSLLPNIIETLRHPEVILSCLVKYYINILTNQILVSGHIAVFHMAI